MFRPLLTVEEGPGPLAGRIGQGLALEIRRGRLRPGERLPGSRRLAESLGVHRNTVLAALRGLEAEGWLRTEPGRGTFVVDDLPDVAPAPFAPPGAAVVPGYALPPALPDLAWSSTGPTLLPLLGGLPDVSAAPADALVRAWRRALRRGPGVLGYGDPRGVRALREELAAMLRALRGLPIDADHVLVTRGAQLGLYLAARALLRPGDVVGVEALGYRPAWAALAATGARLVPLPVDADGLVVDALPAGLRAIYLTPHHQYPTTVTLPAARRLALLQHATAHGVALIEDDYDHEFHYEGRPVLPLASADAGGVVLHCGTLSKVFAPGLRLGYVVAPPPVIEAMARWRTVIDRQGDALGETAIAELLGDGELPRHIRRMRRIYQERRGILVEAVRRALPFADFTVPAGGMALWCRLPPEVDADAWAARALARGVAVQAGSRFLFSGEPCPALRLGFAALPGPKLEEAVARLAACAPPLG
ncbi:MAG: PLP-dependent aminotransferase family protein [Myxococcales bacterium]|nr:PLP-dependent aminotransferase family protein [Myxococcales bacterium]